MFSGIALFLFFAFGFSFAQDPAKIGEIQKAKTEKGVQTKDGEIDISRMTQAQLNSMMGGLPPEPGTPDRPRQG